MLLSDVKEICFKKVKKTNKISIGKNTQLSKPDITNLESVYLGVYLKDWKFCMLNNDCLNRPDSLILDFFTVWGGGSKLLSGSPHQGLTASSLCNAHHITASTSHRPARSLFLLILDNSERSSYF